ncbi:Hypothetical predicted protein [Pelobates cultripes]|uniref:Uncharacterized protein n=1 Tax=Pelobates cultripes TaxID=61616 RepID=A0AAD1WJE1_PELCU|nr:Hypothetical predicted protein [Pelobates cultripes]
MSKKDVACFWIVLLLCQELRTDLIAEMGPSSGIPIQETPRFILTEEDPDPTCVRQFGPQDFYREVSNRSKRLLVCATVGAVVATGMSAANSITVQKLDMEMFALKQHINDIHQVIKLQRTLLQDVLTIVEDTVVTTNLHL